MKTKQNYMEYRKSFQKKKKKKKKKKKTKCILSRQKFKINKQTLSRCL